MVTATVGSYIAAHFIRFGAERYGSAAPGSRSEAEAVRRRLQPVVRPGPGKDTGLPLPSTTLALLPRLTLPDRMPLSCCVWLAPASQAMKLA